MGLHQAAVFHVKRTTAGTGVRPAALPRSHDRSRISPPALGRCTKQPGSAGPGVHHFRKASSRTTARGKARATTTGGSPHRTGADCERSPGTTLRRRVRSTGVDELLVRRSDVGSGRVMRTTHPSHATTVTHNILACRFAPLFDENTVYECGVDVDVSRETATACARKSDPYVRNSRLTLSS